MNKALPARMTLFEGSGSASGDVLNDHACTDNAKGEPFRELKIKQKTPLVSFSGSEKSAKRATASASRGNLQAPKKATGWF